MKMLAPLFACQERYFLVNPEHHATALLKIRAQRIYTTEARPETQKATKQ